MTARGWAGVLLALLLAAPGQALAHGVLRDAEPAAGALLSVAPREIRLRFNQPVGTAVARIVLTGPDGRAVALGALAHAPDSADVLRTPVVGPLVAGEYTVRWQVVGPDGHPVRGEHRFRIAPGAAGLWQPRPADAPPAAAPAAPSRSEFDAESPLYVVARWLTLLGMVGAIGPVAYRLGVAPRVRGALPGTAGWVAGSSASAARLGLAAAAVLAVGAVMRLWAQWYALSDAATAPRGVLSAVLFRTPWGRGWLLQGAAVVAVAVGFRLAARSRRARAGWTVAAVAAVGLALSAALSGHAAAASRLPALAVLADAAHVLGAGGWMGGLLVVLLAGVPAARRLPEDERGAAVARLVDAFSPVALACAAAVTVTGAASAWLHLGGVQALLRSDYGEVLLLKLGVLSLLFATGAYNWLRVRPALGTEGAAARLQRSGGAELAAAVAVLLVTAVLVATPPPEM